MKANQTLTQIAQVFGRSCSSTTSSRLSIYCVQRLSPAVMGHRAHSYAAGITAWLWPVILCGRSGRVHNVGSMGSLSILALAQRVAKVLQVSIDVRPARVPPQGHVPHHCVPQTKRAFAELGLGAPLGLDEALRRTAYCCRCTTHLVK
jgi:hypothetical protein